MRTLVHLFACLILTSPLVASDRSSLRAAYEREQHAVRKQGDGVHSAWNSRQQWRVDFDGRGFLVRPQHGEWIWGMDLQSVGESRVSRTRNTVMDAVGNKASYHWSDSVEEWFINDQRGLEQGWTIKTKQGDGPLELSFRLRGELVPAICDEGSAVSFHQAGKKALTYGGLKAWDATGNMLEARFAPVGDPRSIAIRVDDEGATYPITIDPLAQQAYLKASNAGAEDEFGWSVDIDGDTAVVGAYKEDGDANSTAATPNDNASNAGAVYVFVRSESGWNQQAYLKASNTGAGDNFGSSVAIDGDTLVVGATGEDGDTASTAAAPNEEALSSGAVYVFQRIGTTWNQQAYLKASNGSADDLFGNSVAIDGDTLVAGAYNEGEPRAIGTFTSGQGAAYVFVRNGADWTEQAWLQNASSRPTPQSHTLLDHFGWSVDIDGDTVVVGARDEDGDAASTAANPNNNFNNSGAAFVFVRDGTGWSQQAYLKASTPSHYGRFGHAVSIDGDRLVVGAPEYNVGLVEFGDGKAYVFERSETSWSQQKFLEGIGELGGEIRFGFSVELDGDAIAIGAPSAHGIEPLGTQVLGGGAVFVFERGGTDWNRRVYLKSSNAERYDRFGHSVGLDGDTVLIGARDEDGDTQSTASAPNNSAEDAGAAYIFDFALEPDASDIVVEQPLHTELVSGMHSSAYGTEIVGSVGLSKTFVVRNMGAEPLSDLAFGLTGAGAADYVVDTARISSLGGILAPCSAETFTIAFAPTAVGIRPAVLHITSNDPNENPFAINLSGEGVVPLASTEEAYLKSETTDSDDHFGNSVAIDGDTMVIGAPGVYFGPAGRGRGVADVFVRDGDQWVRQARLSISDFVTTNRFGHSVAIDGDTVIVGMPSGEHGGSVFVFTRNGTEWSQQAQLYALGTTRTFGMSVALDGNTAIIGAPYESAEIGAAYVFERSGTEWIQRSHLSAFNPSEIDYFGWSVAIDGDCAVIGAPGEDGDSESTIDAPNTNALRSGAAYLYERGDGDWGLQTYLKSSDATKNYSFGQSVAIDRNTLVVSAYRNFRGWRGSAFVFERDNRGADWLQRDRLTAAPSEILSAFGSSVAIDGKVILVGAPATVTGATAGPGLGAAHVFVRVETGWSPDVATLLAPNPGLSDEFGSVVALWGTTVLIGAFGEDGDSASTVANPNDNVESAGAAYIFDLVGLGQAPTALVLAPAEAAENLAEGTWVGTLVASDADAGEQFTYSLVSGEGDGDNSLFTVDGDILRTAAVLDHESQSSAAIRVQVEDSRGLTFEQGLTISILDDRGEDADGDGLNEADEEDLYGTSDSEIDSDGNGVPDWIEVRFPGMPLPILTAGQLSADTVRLEIGSGIQGLGTEVQSSTDLNGNWEQLEDYPDGIPVGQDIQLDVPSQAAEQMFYRLKFYLPG